MRRRTRCFVRLLIGGAYIWTSIGDKPVRQEYLNISVFRTALHEGTARNWSLPDGLQTRTSTHLLSRRNPAQTTLRLTSRSSPSHASGKALPHRAQTNIRTRPRFPCYLPSPRVQVPNPSSMTHRYDKHACRTCILTQQDGSTVARARIEDRSCGRAGVACPYGPTSDARAAVSGWRREEGIDAGACHAYDGRYRTLRMG